MGREQMQVTMNEDGSATVNLNGYLGMCGKCDKDATHAEWCEFDTPIPGNVKFGLPEIKGCWEMICDGCCDKNARHEDE